MLVASQGPGRSRIMLDYGKLLDLWGTFQKATKPKFCYNYNLQYIPHNQLIIILYIKYI